MMMMMVYIYIYIYICTRVILLLGSVLREELSIGGTFYSWTSVKEISRDGSSIPQKTVSMTFIDHFSRNFSLPASRCIFAPWIVFSTPAQYVTPYLVNLIFFPLKHVFRTHHKIFRKFHKVSTSQYPKNVDRPFYKNGTLRLICKLYGYLCIDNFITPTRSFGCPSACQPTWSASASLVEHPALEIPDWHLCQRPICNNSF